MRIKNRQEWKVIGEDSGDLILEDESRNRARISKVLLSVWADDIEENEKLVVYYDEEREVVVFYHTIYSSYIAGFGGGEGR